MSSMEGGSLALLLEPRCSKLEVSLQAFKQWTIQSFFYVRGIPLLYFKVGPPLVTYLYRGVLSR